MHDVLDFISLDETLPILVLIGLLRFVGGQLLEYRPEARHHARRIAAGVFLLYGILAAGTWAPRTATDVLLIALRALLAAGLALGVSLVTLPAACFVYQQTVAKVAAANREQAALVQRQADARRAGHMATLEDENSRTRRRQEGLTQEESERRARERAGIMERELQSRIDDARSEVTRFYEEHEQLIREPLPRALFRSQLKNQFPSGVTADQAFKAAEELIVRMLPLIAEGRARERERERGTKSREERARRLRRQLARSEEKMKRLTQSRVADSETTAPEVSSLSERIRSLREELNLIESNDQKGEA